MGDFNISIPKLGESIQEGTVTKLFVKEGDIIKEEDVLFELATDKVDSEIPSPVGGRIKEVRCSENETYPVGQVVMVISTGEVSTNGEKTSAESEKEEPPAEPVKETSGEMKEEIQAETDKEISENPKEEIKAETGKEIGEEISERARGKSKEGRFYSPLVKNIAEKEGIPIEDLESIEGSGLGGRIQKKDISAYIEEFHKKSEKEPSHTAGEKITREDKQTVQPEGKYKISVSPGAEDTIVQMDRVRKLIAGHMIYSKDVSAHVTTVVEADVSNIVLWRTRVKDEFQKKYNEKLTYLPLVTEAVAKALTEFRNVNVSVDGENIIIRKHINIGIAVAKDDDNLIVPVIKDADTKNILGLTKEINSFGTSARSNKLTPDQLQGGTFSITNFGSFKNLMGTPIINQPQVAILAVGMIEKKPAVIETPFGDAIVVRHKMFLSLSYDHRVVDGMLGGKFLRRIADLLEQFDINREI